MLHERAAGQDLMDLPQRQGLYDPRNEHDSCGVGFVANIKGHKSHDIIHQGLRILVNLDHRGAVGADPLVGDGAGVLVQIPDGFFRQEMAAKGVELPPMFSWLSNQIDGYPDTLNLKMYAHLQQPAWRPNFELERTDHPLAQEYHHGITAERVKEIMMSRIRSFE